MKNFPAAVCALGVAVAVVPAASGALPTTSRPAPAAVDTPVAKPAFVRKTEKGFIDDAMALTADGSRLALIRTDSASFANLEILDLQSGKTVSTWSLGDPQQIFDHVAFIGNAGEILLVTRDATTGQRSAQRFDDKGAAKGMIGPFGEVAFAARGDKHYLVAFGRTTSTKRERGAKPTTVVTLSAYDLADLQAVGKPRTFLVGSDGIVGGKSEEKSRGRAKDKAAGAVNPKDASKDEPGAAGAPGRGLKILSWLDGYTQIMGQQPGGYDQSSDVRTPDRAAIFDALRGVTLWTGEISDVVAWAKVNALRAAHDNRSSFLVVSDDEENLEQVDGLGYRATLGLVEKFEMYDFRSLRESEEPEKGVIHFSLLVDALNPRALARQKAEDAKLDIYRIGLPEPGALRDGKPRPAVHVLRAMMDDRPAAWTVGQGVVVVLRKFKAFSRGGNAIEIYR